MVIVEQCKALYVATSSGPTLLISCGPRSLLAGSGPTADVDEDADVSDLDKDARAANLSAAAKWRQRDIPVMGELGRNRVGFLCRRVRDRAEYGEEHRAGQARASDRGQHWPRCGRGRDVGTGKCERAGVGAVVGAILLAEVGLDLRRLWWGQGGGEQAGGRLDVTCEFGLARSCGGEFGTKRLDDRERLVAIVDGVVTLAASLIALAFGEDEPTSVTIEFLLSTSELFLGVARAPILSGLRV